MKTNNYHISKAAGILTIAAGCLVIAGWFFNIETFKNILPGTVSMKFNTAVCFILCGIALLLLNAPVLSANRKKVALVCAGLVMFTGLLTFSQYIFGFNTGIDELLWKESPGAIGTAFAGRMGIITSIHFILMSFILITLWHKKFHWLIQALLIVMIPGSLLIILNHAFGNSFLNAFPNLNNTAVHTALLFIVLTAGIFFSMPLQYLRFNFKKKIAGFFVLTILLLAFTFFVINQSKIYSATSGRKASTTSEIIFQSDAVLKEAAEMQRGLRGYLLTGEENYLPLFTSSALLTEKYLTRINIIGKDAYRQPRLDEISKLVTTYIQDNKELILLCQAKKCDDDKITAALSESKTSIARLGVLIAALQKEETQQWTLQHNDHGQSIKDSDRVILFFQVITVMLLLAAFIIILRNNQLRNKAESEIKMLNATLEKRVEEKTKEVTDKETQYRFLLQNMREGIQILGKDLQYLFVNDSVLQQSKYSREELLGFTLIEKYPGIENTALYKGLQHCLQNNYTEIIETDFTFPDGSKSWFELSIQPVTEGLFVLSTDITHRKTAEAEIKKYNERLKLIASTSQDALWEWNLQTNELWANDMHQYLYGLTLADAVPAHEQWKERIHAADRERMITTQDAALASDKNVFISEYRFKTGDGQYINMYDRCYIVRNEEGKPIRMMGSMMDITESKKAEEAIRQAKEKYFNLMNSVEGIVWEADAKTFEFSFVSKQAERLLGYPVEEWTSQPTFWADHIYAEDRNEAVNFCATSTKEKRPHEFEYRMVAADGKLIWLRDIVSVQVENDEPVKLSGVMIDITKQKKAAIILNHLNDALIKRTEELNASNIELERFAYIASHDLQEPLRMVSSFLNLLEKKLDGKLDESTTKYIHFAVDGAERMRTLIQALLLYSRVGINIEDFATTDLNDLMKYVVQVLEKDIKKYGAVLNVRTMPVIMANKSLITQLFINLIANALKYHGDKESVIETGYAEEAGNWVFYVKDNGIGIDAKFFEKIFIIFQRLHNQSQYSGTGIGLAICKKIVEIHQGKIWLTSEPGIGSIFYFSIPKQNK